MDVRKRFKESMFNQKRYETELRHIGQKTWLFMTLIGVLAFLAGQIIFGSGWIVLLMMGFTFALGQVMGQKKLKETLLKGKPVRELEEFEAPELYRQLKEIVSRSELGKVPQLYLVQDATSNAFATGDASEPQIYLTTGLFTQLNAREMASVLAHEFAHLENNDMILLRFANLAFAITNFLTFYMQLVLIFAIPLILMGTIRISLELLFVLFFTPFGIRLLTLALMRNREFAADMRAANFTRDPRALANALLKINYIHAGVLSFLTPRSVLNRRTTIYDSHPSPQERIDKLMSLVS